MSKSERIELRVERGMLVPATERASALLRARGYKVGDTVLAEIRKERNPGFHRLAHAIGGLVASNIESFAGYDHHAALKRLQLESGVSCEERIAELPGGQSVMIRQAKSMGFDKMDEVEFRAMISALCGWVASKYWPTLSAEQVEELAQAFVD
jgi:hypothetical protein